MSGELSAGDTNTGLRELGRQLASAKCIIISGAPGSGKGTQCELLTKRYGLAHISTVPVVIESPHPHPHPY